MEEIIMSLYTNEAKKRLLAGEKLSAAWSQTGSTVTAEILAQSGFDMIVVDCEHAPIDPPQLLPIIQAINGYDSMVMARAPWNDLVTIKRMLDCGLQGIHIPYVNNVEETVKAVRACKYPPLGNRGIAGSPRAAGFGANKGQYLQRANDELLVLVALETPEAVANLDAMLDVDYLDGIFIGPMDLSTTMGYFGTPSHPEVQKVIREVEKKVLSKGKLLATVGANAAASKELYERGYSYVIFASDVTTLRASVEGQVKDFNEYNK